MTGMETGGQDASTVRCSESILTMDLLGLGLGRIRVAHVTQFLLRYGTIPAAGSSNSSLSSLIVHT